MNPPKFSVGEEVTVIAGEDVVFDAVIVEFERCWRIIERGTKIQDTYVYYMASPPPGYNIDPAEVGWAEMFLRKKPKPSDQSFEQLMDSLNREVVVA